MKETLEAYEERMNMLFDQVSSCVEGEDMDEVVLVLMRLVMTVLEHMGPVQRRAMMHVVKEYFRIGAGDDADNTIN